MKYEEFLKVLTEHPGNGAFCMIAKAAKGAFGRNQEEPIFRL